MPGLQVLNALMHVASRQSTAQNNVRAIQSIRQALGRVSRASKSLHARYGTVPERMRASQAVLFHAKHAYDPMAYGFIKDLLKNGADPNVIDKRGNTPLVYATARRHMPLIRLLLDAGAHPDYLDSEMSIFDFVFNSLDRQNVELLYSHEFPENNRNNNNNTSMKNKYRNNYENRYKNARGEKLTLEITTLLLKHGANPNRIFNGQTPLGLACENLFKLYDVKDEHRLLLSVIKLFLQGGANPNVHGQGHHSPLEIIMQNWAHALAVHREPHPPIGGQEVVKTLLQAGANPNAHTNGKSVLRIASSVQLSKSAVWEASQKLNMIKLLLRYGARPGMRVVGSVRMPLHDLCRTASTVTSHYEEEYVPPTREILPHVYMIAAVLDAGSPIDPRDGDTGDTPLLLLTSNVLKLKDIGAFTLILKTLLERGADPYMKNTRGQSAFTLAMSRGVPGPRGIRMFWEKYAQNKKNTAAKPRKAIARQRALKPSKTIKKK